MVVMDTGAMGTEHRTATGERQVAVDEGVLDDPLLTVMGLIFESATGAEALLEASLDPESPITGQLLGPLLRLSRSEGGRLRMTDLAAQCHYSASAVTRVADRLEELGLAERHACPGDRRVVHLAITPAGRRTVLSIMPRHVAILRDEIFGGLSDADLDRLEALMRTVRDAVHPCATAVTPPEAVAAAE